jgi:hypothetical protein
MLFRLEREEKEHHSYKNERMIENGFLKKLSCFVSFYIRFFDFFLFSYISNKKWKRLVTASIFVS